LTPKLLLRHPPGEAEEAEIDQQVELVLRHCPPGGGVRTKGTFCCQEQHESCNGEQTEVGEAEEAVIDQQQRELAGIAALSSRGP
jgi:hypothetical protein